MTAHSEPWRNRIVGHEDVAPATLVPNALNPRTHPKAQRAAMGGALTEVGWVQDVIVNRRTGHIVDGHLRVEMAMAKGADTVPVVFVDLSEDEERLVLATFDPLSAMAGTSSSILAELMDGMRGGALSAMIDGLAAAHEVPREREIDTEDDVSDELPGNAALKRDVQFASDLPWDIPMLQRELLGSLSEAGYQTWAGPQTPDDGREWIYQWRTDSIRGLDWDRTLLGFYTNDERFEAFWEHPEQSVAKLLNLGCTRVIAPNYSQWFGLSRASHLWAVFRSRWVGRYLQECGIKVIPDINWADEKSFEFCLIGIPDGPPTLSVQLQTVATPAEMDRACAGLEMALDRLRPESLLVYGMKTAAEVLLRVGPSCRIIRAEPRSAVRRRLMDTRQKG